MRLMIIGGNSRLGRAIARACPPATLMVRGRADGDAIVSVPGYHAATAEDFTGFDAVVNCTGLVKGAVGALDDANVKLPVQLAARAVEAGVRHFVHVSSFAVHGRAERIDDTTPIGPTGPYGASKAEGERALLGGPEAGSVSIVRLPMLYGEGDSKLARLIGAWVKLGWWPAPKGDVARAMMHYDLAASLLVRLAAGPPQGAVAAADVEPFSYAMAQKVIRSAGGRAGLVRLPQRVIRAMKAIGGDAAQALFSDSLLSDRQNLAVTMGLPGRLRSDIAAMVRR